MTNHADVVVAGLDAHTDEHHVAVVDAHGHLLGAAAFPTSSSGYAQLLEWVQHHGHIARIGLESTGAYAAGLVRALRTQAIEVVEVNQPHAHAHQRLGKSDAIDAELAARAALSGTATAVPKDTGGIVEAIRQLSVERAGALKARTAALQQLHDLIITAPRALREQRRRRRTLKAGRRSACACARISAGCTSRCRRRSSLRELARRVVLRCLKRYIARQTSATLRDDLGALNSP